MVLPPSVTFRDRPSSGRLKLGALARPVTPQLKRPDALATHGKKLPGSEHLGGPSGRWGGLDPLSSDSQPVNLLMVCRDRKSTRLNSSHVKISYAVFCLKK